MTACQRCGSARLANVYAHCSDMCTVALAGKRERGYVPRDLGVGGGDAADFTYCLDCGQIKGVFPVPPTRIELGQGDD
jgi:hypothetical protein